MRIAPRGHPRWLGLYPALMAAGLAGTGLGIILAIGLFLAVGPRRTRLFSQIGATAVGASFALGAQAVAMLPDGARAAVLAMFAPPVNGGAPLPNLVWTPVRAAGGEPAAMLAWAGFGAAVFALACLLFGDRFAQAAVVSAGAPAGASGPSDRTARFGASVGAALRAKERRVVWRDPWLMSQLLLQAAYTMPVAVILWRGGGATATVGLAFTPALVVIAVQLAGALAWVALSAEDAPDFLRSAPSPAPRSNAERSRPSASRSRWSSLFPSARSPSPPPGRASAGFPSAQGRSRRRRSSISGGRRRPAAALCFAATPSRSSSG